MTLSHGFMLIHMFAALTTFWLSTTDWSQKELLLLDRPPPQKVSIACISQHTSLTKWIVLWTALINGCSSGIDFKSFHVTVRACSTLLLEVIPFWASIKSEVSTEQISLLMKHAITDHQTSFRPAHTSAILRWSLLWVQHTCLLSNSTNNKYFLSGDLNIRLSGIQMEESR